MDILEVIESTPTTATLYLGDGEQHAVGYTISLYNQAKTTVLQTARTNENGEALFTGLTPETVYFAYYNAAGYTQVNTDTDSVRGAMYSQWEDLARRVKTASANVMTVYINSRITSGGHITLYKDANLTTTLSYFDVLRAAYDGREVIFTWRDQDEPFYFYDTYNLLGVHKVEEDQANIYKFYVVNGDKYYILTGSLVYADNWRVLDVTDTIEGVKIGSAAPTSATYYPIGTIYVDSTTGNLYVCTDRDMQQGTSVWTELASTDDLNDKIKTNAGTPTTSTVGIVGQLLEDTTNGKLYICTAVNEESGQPTTYTWSEVGAGGGGGTGLTILSYGTSTYGEALAAYQANKLIYCRASSNNDPSQGDQLRMAFLAYVNSQTTPTEFEFQYYRSVSSKNITTQGDETFVYKLNQSTGWSVTKRNNYTRITAGTGLTGTYSSGVLTLDSDAPVITMTSTDPGEGSALAANHFVAVYSRS